MKSGYKNHKYSLKNILAAGLLSVPLLFGSCSKEIHPTENYSGIQIVTEQQKETTPKSQSKLEQKLKQTQFHEELSNEEYELLNQKYGNDSKSITKKMEDPNFSMYSIHEGMKFYSDLERNSNQREFSIYYVSNNNIIEILRKKINEIDEYSKDILEKYKLLPIISINLNYDDREIFSSYSPSLDEFSNKFEFLYWELKKNTSSHIINNKDTKLVRFTKPTNPATINKDGKIISPDLKILGQVDKKVFEFLNNIKKIE